MASSAPDCHRLCLTLQLFRLKKVANGVPRVTPHALGWMLHESPVACSRHPFWSLLRKKRKSWPLVCVPAQVVWHGASQVLFTCRYLSVLETSIGIEMLVSFLCAAHVRIGLAQRGRVTMEG